METIVQRACGLDVHQASITACIKRQGIEKQIHDIWHYNVGIAQSKALAEENQITHIAMESTGIYWKPVFPSQCAFSYSVGFNSQFAILNMRKLA